MWRSALWRWIKTRKLWKWTQKRKSCVCIRIKWCMWLDVCMYLCMSELTLPGRLIVAWVEGGSESRRWICDVSVKMAASAAICKHSYAQHQYHTQQQGPDQTSVDCYTHTWSHSWKRDRKTDSQDIMRTHLKTRDAQKGKKHYLLDIIWFILHISILTESSIN